MSYSAEDILNLMGRVAALEARVSKLEGGGAPVPFVPVDETNAAALQALTDPEPTIPPAPAAQFGRVPTGIVDRASYPEPEEYVWRRDRCRCGAAEVYSNHPEQECRCCPTCWTPQGEKINRYCFDPQGCGLNRDQELRSIMRRDLGKPDPRGRAPTLAEINGAVDTLIGLAFDNAERHARRGDGLSFVAWARVWVALLLIRDSYREDEDPATILGHCIALARSDAFSDEHAKDGQDSLLTLMYG